MDRVAGVEALENQPSLDEQHLLKLFEEQVYNLNGGTVYFPIRHHSPACSYHLLNTIRSYKPDMILIEGPESGNPLIPVIADEATETPVSLYCTYESGEDKAACYYPLLSYSPEYVAIREAAKLNIPAQFIDLDYDQAPESDDEGQGQRSLQDESLLAGSEFINRLCRKLNCRSFDELWEKVFEIGGLHEDTAAFIRDVFMYCTLSRLCYTEERLRLSNDLAREGCMRRHIKAASENHERVLVITGGFHTYGLLQGSEPGGALVKADSRGSKEIKRQMYPMVFTFAEADRLNGYASGMPYVNYYELIWQRLLSGKAEPYHETALTLLTQLTRKLREGREHVSTSDAIEAYSMLQGLAALRGKHEGGVYELLDAALAAFVKGERTLATEKPLEELRLLLTGDRIGVVASNPFSIPIVEDFKALCAASGLQIKTTGKQKKVLELYAKPEHRIVSQLLQGVSYLVPDFTVRQSGPDWLANRDMNLVRETWTYAYSSRIEARLIECSLYGGTIHEAAVSKLEEEIREIPEHHSGEMSGKLLQALLMGLQATVGRLYEQVKAALRQDGHFLSLCQTLKILSRIHQHGRMLGLSEDKQLPLLVAEAYDNAVDKLPQLARTKPDEHAAIVQGLKLLLMLAESSDARFRSETFRELLSELLTDHALPAQLEGVCIAIAAALGDKSREDIVQRARGYVHGTPDQARQTALYLQGVFTIARDAFLYDDLLLTELNVLIEELPYEDFIQMVPDLRLAFTYFTQAETAIIADRVAHLHQAEPEELERLPIDEGTLIRAKALDEAIRKEFAAWKLA